MLPVLMNTFNALFLFLIESLISGFHQGALEVFGLAFVLPIDKLAAVIIELVMRETSLLIGSSRGGGLEFRYFSTTCENRFQSVFLSFHLGGDLFN